MDAVLCLREATHFQSMELERPEAICGLESGTRSRLWSTRGDCACGQEVTFFGLRLAGTEIACLNQFSSVFSWLQICRHRGDHESNVCVLVGAERQLCHLGYTFAGRAPPSAVGLDDKHQLLDVGELLI